MMAFPNPISGTDSARIKSRFRLSNRGSLRKGLLRPPSGRPFSKGSRCDRILAFPSVPKGKQSDPSSFIGIVLSFRPTQDDGVLGHSVWAASRCRRNVLFERDALHFSDYRFDLLDRNSTRSQKPRCFLHERENRRFHAHLTRPAVKDEIYLGPAGPEHAQPSSAEIAKGFALVRQ